MRMMNKIKNQKKAKNLKKTSKIAKKLKKLLSINRSWMINKKLAKRILVKNI